MRRTRACLNVGIFNLGKDLLPQQAVRHERVPFLFHLHGVRDGTSVSSHR